MEFNPKQMLVSGFERYVRIVETIRNSDEFMSQGDRMTLISDMLEEPGNPTVEEINQRCKQLADENLGYNMALAQTWRSANNF